MIKGNLMQPYACTIQLYGLGLESLWKIHEGWDRYMQMEVKQTKDGKDGRSFGMASMGMN